MSIIEKTREAAKLLVGAYAGFTEILHEHARIGEAENRLASISRLGYSFVFALREFKVEQPTCIYISMLEEADELLMSGMDEAEILWYFEKRFRDERR